MNIQIRDLIDNIRKPHKIITLNYEIIFFITLFTGLSVNAQMEKLEGIWKNKDTSFYTTILYNEETSTFDIFNFSFKEDKANTTVV